MLRIAPDRAALEVAHVKLRTSAQLDDMLKDPSLKIILEAVARRHMQRRAGFDPKKLQSNDQS